MLNARSVSFHVRTYVLHVRVSQLNFTCVQCTAGICRGFQIEPHAWPVCNREVERNPVLKP